jgi:hypothetical protein
LTTFVALYRGDSIGAAKLLALSAKPELVHDFAARMLHQAEDHDQDPVLAELEDGRRRALRLVQSGNAEQRPYDR